MTEPLQITDIVVGDGAEAKKGARITVHYTGKLTDGTVFDSSIPRGQPFDFTLGAVTGQNIVMLGNSLTERGFWAEYFQGKRVLNRGIGCDCISGMINRVQPIVDGRPKAIFIMGGANDLLFSKISNEKLLQQYERLLDMKN